jgi:hypothetical protein
MKQLDGWTRKACCALAAGAACLGSSFAQEAAPRLEPVPAQRADKDNKQGPVVRQVALSVDGTFRVAVVTRSGRYVPGARLTLVRDPDSRAGGVQQAAATDRQTGPVKVTTGPAGPSVVMGVKPGYYLVRVEVKDKVSDSVLLVKASPEASSGIVPAQLLIPCPDSDDNDDRRPLGAIIPEGAEDPGLGLDWAGAALGAAGIGGLGAAIALPITLSQRHGAAAGARASP